MGKKIVNKKRNEADVLFSDRQAKKNSKRPTKARANNDVEFEIADIVFEFVDTLQEKYNLGSEEAMSAVLEALEGVNIPLDESEQIHKLAQEEGTTFTNKLREYIALGMVSWQNNNEAQIKKARSLIPRAGIFVFLNTAAYSQLCVSLSYRFLSSILD